MNYSILSQNISIVILGKFVPESIDPIWMVKNNILAIEDLENGFKSSPEMLFFRTRKFEVLINRDRLQVVSFSISDSDLICDFVIKLLMCKKSEELKAVGMNSQKIFSLLSDFDMLNFCHHFAPLDALTPISYNSLMLNMEWQSWEEPQTDSSPSKQISLKRVIFDKNRPCFSISVNNHRKISSFEEAIKVIKTEANQQHFAFNEQFKRMMESF